MSSIGRYGIVVMFFMVCSLATRASEINISIYNEQFVKSFVFTTASGAYELLLSNHDPVTIESNDIVYLTLVNRKIAVMIKSVSLGEFDSIHFTPLSPEGVFRIRSVNPSERTRLYDGELNVFVDFNRLLLVNTVSVDKYLAGVVETEAGASALPEFYKAQALLCRTYARDNLHRHIEEGFNLCDGTHCQAYKGRNASNPAIYKAVKSTHNEVVVDANKELITAAFHSNSGGYTEDAQNIWLVNLPYLKSVNDPFSLRGRNVHWKKEITRSEWIDYLKKNGFYLHGSDTPGFFTQKTETRCQNYTLGLDFLPCVKIRADWNLRSAWFSVIDDGSKIFLIGKGYGHGAGMSQEGAMQMARAGYSYVDIIHYYFKDVNIITLHEE